MFPWKLTKIKPGLHANLSEQTLWCFFDEAKKFKQLILFEKALVGFSICSIAR